jgi:hypothetical protein
MDVSSEALVIYQEVMTDPQSKIFCQGGDADTFCVDYGSLTEKLTDGEFNHFDNFLLKATSVPCIIKKKTAWHMLTTGLCGWYSIHG